MASSPENVPVENKIDLFDLEDDYYLFCCFCSTSQPPRNVDQLVLHISRDHQETIYVCPGCPIGSYFYTQAQIKNHLENRHWREYQHLAWLVRSQFEMVAAFDSLQENESHNSNGSILRRSPRNRKLRGERSEDVKTSKACLQRGVGDEDAASPKQRSSSENTPSEDSSNDQVIGEPSSARKILFQDIEMDEAEAAFDREVEAALEEVQSKLVAVEQRLGTLDQSNACADENNNVPVAGPSGVRKVRQKSDDFYHSFSDDSSDKSSSMPKNFMYTERPNAKDGVCNNLFILCLVCLKTFQKTGDVEKHWRRTHSANN